LGAGDRGVDRGVVLLGSQQLGQGAFGAGQLGFRGGEMLTGGDPGRVGDLGGVGVMSAW